MDVQMIEDVVIPLTAEDREKIKEHDNPKVSLFLKETQRDGHVLVFMGDVMSDHSWITSIHFARRLEFKPRTIKIILLLYLP